MKVTMNYTNEDLKWELLASIADSLFQMSMDADVLRAAAMHVDECTPELNALWGTLTALGRHYHKLAAQQPAVRLADDADDPKAEG